MTKWSLLLAFGRVGASELGGQAREPGRRGIDQQRLQPFVDAGCHEEADRDQQGTEQGLAALAGFHQPSAPASQGFARQEPNGDERNGRTDAEGDHGERYLSQVLALGREDRRRAKRRPDARAPYRPEQQAKQELTA